MKKKLLTIMLSLVMTLIPLTGMANDTPADTTPAPSQSNINNVSLNFTKNADTIATVNETPAEVELYTMKNGELVKKTETTTQEDGTTTETPVKMSVKYATINKTTWFNGLSDGNKTGKGIYDMYFSGLTSTAFNNVKDENGNIKFNKVYITDSTWEVDSDTVYTTKFHNEGFGPDKDAFVVNTDTPLTVDLRKERSSYVRFASMVYGNTITAKITYKDGSVDTFTKSVAGCGTMENGDNNKKKYFSELNSTDSFKIVGRASLGANTQLYPNGYYWKINDTNADYCVTRDIDNSVSADYRVGDNRIRYYEPKIYLFEVKVDENKIPENLKLSVNSLPTVIYSVDQGIGVSENAQDSIIDLRSMSFAKNADTLANFNDTKITGNYYSYNSTTKEFTKLDGTTSSFDYATIDRNTWFNGLPSSKFHTYFSGLATSSMPENGLVTFYKMCYKTETTTKDDGTKETKNILVKHQSDKTITDKTTWKTQFDKEGLKAGVKDAFLLYKTTDNETLNTPEVTMNMAKEKTSFIRFSARIGGDCNVIATIKYLDGTSDEYKIDVNLDGNLTAHNKNYPRYLDTEERTKKAVLIGALDIYGYKALYPSDYTDGYRFGATRDLNGSENFVSADRKFGTEGKLRYYDPSIYLYEVEVNEGKIPVSLTLATSSGPVAVYSADQGVKVESKTAFSNFSYSSNEATVTVDTTALNITENYTPYFALYSATGKLLGVSCGYETDGTTVKVENVSTAETPACAQIFFWSNDGNYKPLHAPETFIISQQ